MIKVIATKIILIRKIDIIEKLNELVAQIQLIMISILYLI